MKPLLFVLGIYEENLMLRKLVVCSAEGSDTQRRQQQSIEREARKPDLAVYE